MHRAAHYLCRKFTPNVKKTVVESYVVTPADVAAITAALGDDASDYYYSACISVIDALRAIDTGFYTWSTVKMYYAVFYALRSILARDGIVYFRPVKAPFHVASTPGATPQFANGQGDHKALLGSFRARNPAHVLLSQDIELIDALDWMIEKRESANYFIPRFCEPSIPSHYAAIAKLGIRKAVASYLDSSPNLLTFDKDHAIVAFPLAVLKIVGDMAIAGGGDEIEASEMAFLRSKRNERRGALAPLITYLLSTVRT